MIMEEKTTDLSKILSIVGKPGLYKTIAQSKNGVIVESLSDGKRFQVFSHDKVSSLTEISVFTQNEDMPLLDILKSIKEKTNNGLAPDPKSDNQKLKDFFESVIPEYDRDRVYVSHMKKICAWYNLLHEKDMLEFPEEEDKDEQQADSNENKEEEKDNTGDAIPHT